MPNEIKTFRITTKAGNTLEFFYNPENDLVVVDLTHKNMRGGKELLRKTLNEKKLIGFCTKLPKDPPEVDESDLMTMDRFMGPIVNPHG